jgi:hypothetical protein
MKRLVYLLSIFLLLFNSACKKEETKVPDQFPEWLQQKIGELTPDQKMCEITTVTIIEYNGKIYYHVYCGLWSCMYCQLFDEHGNRPVWDEKGWNDFFANQKFIKEVPACQ